MGLDAMYEQRLQAYWDLIEQLLDCEQGQEAELLQAQAELVDAGLVAAMRLVADWMERQGEEDAGWMRQFAGQVALDLALAEARTGFGDAVDFAVEIVQLIAQTQGDRTRVYQFFQSNLDRLDEQLLLALPELFATLIPQNDPKYIAAVFGEFGNLIQQSKP